MDGRPSPQLRLLAPIALAVFALAFLLVVFGGGDDSATESGTAGAESAEQSTDGEQPRPGSASATYTVKAGDTLGDISERTGLDIDRLLELNPALDPQSLSPGQTIKLRE
jgi:LysM repeat protein